MNLRTRSSVFIGVLCTVYGVLAAPSGAAEVLGGHEGWLDRMGAGVRELGRGNTGTALENSSPAAYWNPAVLPFLRKTELGLGADIRSLGRTGGFAALQGRVATNLSLGAAVINRGDYNVQAYDENENDIGYARPQAFATYFGMGMRTSRRNAFGASLQAYTSWLDLGYGVGEVDFVGGVNLGWYRRITDSLSVAATIRNLGLNPRLSAEFEQSVGGDESEMGYGVTARDYFPKTLVVAAEWRKTLWNRPFAFAGEVMDYQLSNQLFTADPGLHRQALRLGVEAEVAEKTHLRVGLDRLNPTFGLGYNYRWSRRRSIQFDYALILERGMMTFNPYAVGIKTQF
jgi:hypothetical protein